MDFTFRKTKIEDTTWKRTAGSSGRNYIGYLIFYNTALKLLELICYAPPMQEQICCPIFKWTDVFNNELFTADIFAVMLLEKVRHNDSLVGWNLLHCYLFEIRSNDPKHRRLQSKRKSEMVGNAKHIERERC